MSSAHPNAIDAVEAAFSVGDEGALKGAYEAYGSLVYTFSHRLVGTAHAGDVTKEVFVGAWRDRARFDSSGMSLAAWLMAIARSRIGEKIRQHGRLSEETDVAAESKRIGDRMLVANAMQGLPEQTRIAIELALIDGLTDREIAQREALPLETVGRDIRRGLERIRRDLMPLTA
ncbi:MAG: sigma-70 family RNA polymerase sigma factor [Acidimicrobiales bacterium]|nr:sigma-70 family RNA polymerase sigma factor [Acidimicrobiales bacterium]